MKKFPLAAALFLSLIGVLVPPAAAARCATPPIVAEPERPPLPATQLELVRASQTVVAIVAALGPPQVEQAAGAKREVEWQFDDRRGLLLRFSNPCRRPKAFQVEAMHSRRRAEVRTRAGLWVVSKAQIDEVNARGAALGLTYTMGAPDPFFLAGDTMTIGFTPILSYQAMAPGRPEDDIYRIATRWVGEDLHFAAPEGGKWFFHARFRDDHFEVDWQGADPRIGVVTWRFERTPVESASEYALSLAKPRGFWNYALERESETVPEPE